MTNNYFNNYQSGYGNAYTQYGNSLPYRGGQQPFPNSPYSYGGVQQGGYDASVRNFNRMQQTLHSPAYYYNQQQNFNAYQRPPQPQQPQQPPRRPQQAHATLHFPDNTICFLCLQILKGLL